jgi:histidinol-phosphate aminotransferase
MTILKKSYSHTYAVAERAEIDLSLSENPLGPSSKVTKAIKKAAGKSHLYPVDEKPLIKLIAKKHHVAEDSILLGAGANQLLEDFLKVFALRKSIVVPAATFPESVACMNTLQGSVHSVSLRSNMHLDIDALLMASGPDTALIHICNPNNPTGIWTESSQLLQLAEQSQVPLLISEAGADFVEQTILDRSLHPKIIVVRSFSKAYGLAGLRIGYSIASPTIITAMRSSLRSYRVSSLAIAGARAALEDREHLKKSIAYIQREKAWLMGEMSALNFKIVPSQGQTFIAKVPEKFNSATDFCMIAKQHGIAVIDCSLYCKLDQYIRISPQKQVINKKFIVILKKIIGEK